jgi:hypothetical protein
MVVLCEICGEPMPPGEDVFKCHGYSGPCPKPPLLQPQPRDHSPEALKRRLDIRLNDYLSEMKEGYDDSIVGFNEAWDVMRKFFADVAKESGSGSTEVKG